MKYPRDKAAETEKEEVKEPAAEAKEEDECPCMEVAEFLDCFHNAGPILHKMHLRVEGPGSFAAHKALDELYSAMPDHVDDIAEAYQGYAQKILPDVAQVDQAYYLKMTPLEYVNYLIGYVDEYRKAFGEVSPVQNLIDELQATLYKGRYKLKFLA